MIIKLDTEEVIYSDVRYTEEDMSYLEDIPSHIAEKAKAYAEQIPTPPHIDPEGKKLLVLSLYGWYAKADGKVYGIVKTIWIYEEEDMGQDPYSDKDRYYDDSYILYDAVAGTAQNISRDDLLALTGPRNVYVWEYGKPEEKVYC